MYDWDEKPELNITPLVDVMLVLMSILMVTAPTIYYEEQMELPQGSASKAITKLESLSVEVNKERVVSFKNEKIKLEAFPDNFLMLSKEYKKDRVVFLRADKALNYGDVMFILKSIKEAGFTKVSFVTQ